MAGDWIKIEEAMPEKPEVTMIAEILGIEDPDTVAGKLIRVWSWATRNCNADGVTNVTVMKHLDRCAGVSGFALAMEKAGWLAIEGEKITFPNFDRHCSQTAKERALTQKRVGAHRKRKCNGDSVTKTLPEKRREEKKRDGEEEESPSSLLDFAESDSQSVRPPTFDHVESFARSQPMPISGECVEAFFDEMEALQWTYKGRPCVTRSAWQARFRKWTTYWINNANGRKAAAK